MKLDVPLMRQDENSFDCGLAGVAMLFKYYNIDKNYSQIKKDLEIFENVGTFAPQIGSYLIKFGFEVEIVQLSPFLFTLNDVNKSQDKIIIYFKELLKNSKNKRNQTALKYYIEFLENGGKLKIKIPKFEDIKEEIDNKRPLGALLTTSVLQPFSTGFNFHFNIITGYEKDNLIVNDPSWNERGGEFRYKIEDFLFALYSSAYGDLDNASLIKIKKKQI